jgi:hypothetical protein
MLVLGSRCAEDWGWNTHVFGNSETGEVVALESGERDHIVTFMVRALNPVIPSLHSLPYDTWYLRAALL